MGRVAEDHAVGALHLPRAAVHLIAVALDVVH